MWLLFAVLSALFAGLCAILAKCGIRRTDTTVATAIRTIVVLILSFFMVLLVGSLGDITSISQRTWFFLVLSGILTGASWLCYFRALQIGDINKVVPIDKSSTVLTILLAALLLGEPLGWLQALAIFAIGGGTLLMIERKQAKTGERRPAWLLYAVLSAVFAALCAITAKIGITDVESNLGTMIRTAVVLVLAWMMVFVTGKGAKLREMPRRELGFIVLSGVATGASWLCYYRALQTGPASVVVPIDKLSILVTIAFSYLVFGERLSRRPACGLILIVCGTLLLLIK